MLVATLIVDRCSTSRSTPCSSTRRRSPSWPARSTSALIAGKHIFGDTGGTHRRRPDLHRPHLLDQRHDVDRAARDHGHGRGHPAAARLLAQDEQRRRRRWPSCSSSPSSTLLLLTQSFEAVLEFIQFSLTFCSFLAVLGVIVLRMTQPDLPRPYRTWGYPADAVRLPRRHGFHDVLPADRAPAASRWPASRLMLAGLAHLRDDPSPTAQPSNARRRDQA